MTRDIVQRVLYMEDGAGQQVWDHIASNPHCTARDVARDCFGGTGDVRTYERNKAHRIVAALIDIGAIKVERGAGSNANRYVSADGGGP